MRVLGISPLDKDSTASFVEDGRVVFACGEERLSRTKLQDGFPMKAIQLGLEWTGWSLESIDAVAYSFFDAKKEAQLMRRGMKTDRAVHSSTATADSLRLLPPCTVSADRSQQLPIPGLDASAERMPRKAWHKRAVFSLNARSSRVDHWLHRHCYRQWVAAAAADHALRQRELADGLAALGLESKLRRFNHHLCHAANAFYMSGYEEALVLTLDGYGSGNCGAVYRANRNGLEKLHEFPFPNSLGQYYEHVTSALGFRPGRHEGKIVGLAAYGDPEILGPSLRARFEGMEEGDIRMKCAMNCYYSRMLAQRYLKRDIAAAYQAVLEEVVQQVASYWVRQTGLGNICLSGGVNANVKLNQRIRECDGVDSVFVYPNMGDGGCATGAALLLFPAQELVGQSLNHVYHGPSYRPEEIRAALDAEHLEYTYHDAIECEIAKRLAQDQIVARFDGRMEYGPRALGNRSILYPAQDPAVNLWLNHQLGRTEFMPFAPAAMREYADELFHNVAGCEKTAEFMTITFDCTEKMKKSCPAAVHVDGTARPQLVSPTTNAGFYAILKEYEKLTGIPALINTSFNMHEEPIVCSPGDAVRAFLAGRIDYLAIGDFLVPHPSLAQITEERAVTNGCAVARP